MGNRFTQIMVFLNAAASVAYFWDGNNIAKRLLLVVGGTILVAATLYMK